MEDREDIEEMEETTYSCQFTLGEYSQSSDE